MPESPEESFVQRRVMLASLLSAVAIMGYFYLGTMNAPPVEPAPPPAEAQVSEAPAVEQTTPEPVETPVTEPAAAPEQLAVVAADAEREITVITDTFEVVFSNRGAVAKSWVLSNFLSISGEPLDLVHQAGAAEFGMPFSVSGAGGVKIPGLNEALYAVNSGPVRRRAPVELTFEYSDGDRRASKTFRFEKEGYVVEVETEIEQAGVPQPHLINWPGGFGDTPQTQDSLYSTVFYRSPETGEIERNEAGDAEETRLASTGVFAFAGIDDLFFTATFIPDEGATVQLETSSVEIAPDPSIPDAKELFAGVAVGSISGANSFRAFIGPKDVDELQAVDPMLRRVVDFGFFSFIAEPLFLMLRWTHANVVSNWGWSIVIVTIFVNFALFPLKWKGSRSMKRMQQLQPLVKDINDRYKGLPPRDPKKQQQSEELMALYKKYGVNPVGGCFPMLLQIPFFYGFYKVLMIAIEMRQAEWMWVPDLSQPETLAIRILPLAMVASQFYMQSLTPQAPTMDPAQMRLMKFMPLMFGFIFYQFQAGLVLYWLTSNIVGVGQQLLMNKLPGETLDIELPGKRGKKKKK